MQRQSFLSALRHRPPPDGRRTWLALVDVDRFDVLEELGGYEAARSVLAELGADIGGALPSCLHVTPSRGAIAVGFAADDADDAERLMDGLAGTIGRMLDLEGYAFALCVTIGVVEAAPDPSPEQTAIAERAVARARRERRRVAVEQAAEMRVMSRGLDLVRALQHAIRDDALELHYQPKVRARTGETAAVEALLRWRDPTGSFIAPDLFIPLAERTGDIAALTEWVVGRAIADQATLLRRGHRLAIDINISSSELADPAFGWRLLHRFTAVQGQIGFEITETAMMDEPRHALTNLQTFAEAGIRLAIDDYGSGFSSLAYLQQLPITELKIDKMFIQRLTHGHRDPLLIRSTIDLAHALEMEVTAEGVESATTLALLQVMGCDLVQGYHLARPLALDALTDYLAGEDARIAQIAGEADARLSLRRRGRVRHA